MNNVTVRVQDANGGIVEAPGIVSRTRTDHAWGHRESRTIRLEMDSATAADFQAATSIGISAFHGCSALTALILRSATMCELSSTDAFSSTPIASGTGYIYVPAALVDSYKEATNWKTYASQFRALEDYTVDGTTTGALDETKI